MQIEEEVSFLAILQNDEPNFIDLKRTYPKLDIIKQITGIAAIFLRSQFPNQTNNPDVAIDFAADILEHEPTWQIADVINFFKFVRRRQDIPELKMYGSINSSGLMRFVPFYEEEKADEREKLINNRKDEGHKNSTDIVSALLESGKISPERLRKDKLDNPVSIKMGKLLEQAQLKNDGKKAAYDTPADEKYFSKYTEPEIPIEYRDTPPKPYPTPEESFEPNIEST